MKVASKYLECIAGIFWSVAGFNVARIGLLAWEPALGNLANLWMQSAATLSVFAFFFGFIFRRMYNRYTVRFAQLPLYSPIWHIFDCKGWIIILFMIGLGVTLRAFHLVPLYFIAFFYTGLGTALLFTGIRFLWHYANKLRNV